MLEPLVPDVVRVAETRHDDVDAYLFPSERAALGRAVAKRRREFVTGRACARRALARLGVPAVAVPAGAHGEPIWPAGVVGSITHCTGYRACAVAWGDDVRAIGIDAEPNVPLPDGVLEAVASSAERGRASAGAADSGRLLFSTKEAAYKAWFGLARGSLDFHDVEVWVDADTGTFHAEIRAGAGPSTVLEGRWAVSRGIICTAVMVPAPRDR